MQTLRTFAEHDILVAVADRVGKGAEITAGAIRFKKVLRPQQVLDRLVEARAPAGG